MEVLLAFTVGMISSVLFWALGFGGMVSLLVMVAILLGGVSAYTFKGLLKRVG